MVMIIQNQSFCFNSGIVTLYIFFLISLVLYTLASPTLHYCRHDQRDALLEFKHEFPVNESNSSPDYDASLSSWNKTSDCCSWKGVKCDANSGEVISLNLSYIPLKSSLKPNSGLFKLQNLRNLTLKNCSLYGEIPPSIGNFSRLTKLNLVNNNLVGQVPSSLGNLTQLRYLDLSQNQLSGSFPFSLANLTNLYLLYIHDNSFESTLPPDLSGLHNLVYFGVGENSFSGPFPTSLFTIPSLLYFDIRGSQFTGPIEFGNKSSLSSLKYINIMNNKFDGVIPESLSEFASLGEIDFSYNSFTGSTPRSLSNLVNLYYLDLSGNKLEGQVPSFLWRLNVVKLSYNYFNSFEKSHEAPPHETNIVALALNSNSFRGPFPQWICKLTSLHILDMANNEFSGSVPQCFGNSVVTLEEIFMQHNKISGIHPDVFVNATILKALDISNNKLAGKLPKSLINCTDLKFVNLKSNEIEDEFPYWLASLPSLNILLLGSNQFYGPIYHRDVSIGFQSLRVIDVSHNDLHGTIPSFYFSNWLEMITLNATYDDWYMKDSVSDIAVYHSMEMVSKGVDTEFHRIRKDFAAIDFSGNNFSGKIPESIGFLKELRLLNLSGNTFTSNIPQSLVNLQNLEALDLSQNQLSGRIPPDLARLSFLSTMIFSHNNLEGPIPRGTQFQSQNCSSFMDNPKLFGLEDVCGATHVPNPTPEEPGDLSESEEQVINWIAAAIAYGPGVFCGWVIGYIFASYKLEWFMEKFGRNKPRGVIKRTH